MIDFSAYEPLVINAATPEKTGLHYALVWQEGKGGQATSLCALHVAEAQIMDLENSAKAKGMFLQRRDVRCGQIIDSMLIRSGCKQASYGVDIAEPGGI